MGFTCTSTLYFWIDVCCQILFERHHFGVLSVNNGGVENVTNVITVLFLCFNLLSVTNSYVSDSLPAVLKSGPHAELSTGMISGAATGLVFRFSHGFKPAGLAGFIGCGAFAVYYFVSHKLTGQMDFASFVDKHIDKYRHYYRG